jgi:hypothetical protein
VNITAQLATSFATGPPMAAGGYFVCSAEPQIILRTYVTVALSNSWVEGMHGAPVRSKKSLISQGSYCQSAIYSKQVLGEMRIRLVPIGAYVCPSLLILILLRTVAARDQLNHQITSGQC